MTGLRKWWCPASTFSPFWFFSFSSAIVFFLNTYLIFQFHNWNCFTFLHCLWNKAQAPWQGIRWSYKCGLRERLLQSCQSLYIFRYMVLVQILPSWQMLACHSNLSTNDTFSGRFPPFYTGWMASALWFWRSLSASPFRRHSALAGRRSSSVHCPLLKGFDFSLATSPKEWSQNIRILY